MSNYLVRAIQAAPNVTVRYETEVIDGSGNGQLTALTLRDRSTGAVETVTTGGLKPACPACSPSETSDMAG
jgi:thioredoxin reductase (NADPH)